MDLENGDEEENELWRGLDEVEHGEAFATPDDDDSSATMITSAAPASASSSPHAVVLHVDIDSFYCEVERMDEPSLRGRPLVVQQFNAGGFVAVSYEVRTFSLFYNQSQMPAFHRPVSCSVNVAACKEGHIS